MRSWPMKGWAGALALAGLVLALPVAAQPAPAGLEDQLRELKAQNESLNHRLDELAKAVDDVALVRPARGRRRGGQVAHHRARRRRT